MLLISKYIFERAAGWFHLNMLGLKCIALGPRGIQFIFMRSAFAHARIDADKSLPT